MKWVNSIAELKEEAEKILYGEDLKKEIGEEVKKKIIRHAKDDVLGVYSPVKYKRRKNGLGSKENIEIEMQKYGVFVKDSTGISDPIVPKDGVNYSSYRLGNIVQQGAYPLFGSKSEIYNSPRPYMDNAAKDLQNNPEKIMKAIKKRF